MWIPRSAQNTRQGTLLVRQVLTSTAEKSEVDGRIEKELNVQRISEAAVTARPAPGLHLLCYAITTTDRRLSLR